MENKSQHLKYPLENKGVCVIWSFKWRFQTGDCVHSSPAIGLDGTVYVEAMMVICMHSKHSALVLPILLDPNSEATSATQVVTVRNNLK